MYYQINENSVLICIIKNFDYKKLFLYFFSFSRILRVFYSSVAVLVFSPLQNKSIFLSKLSVKMDDNLTSVTFLFFTISDDIFVGSIVRLTVEVERFDLLQSHWKTLSPKLVNFAQTIHHECALIRNLFSSIKLLHLHLPPFLFLPV